MPRRIRLLLATLLWALPCAAAAAGPEEYEALEERIIEIAERVKPSVVHIEAVVKVNDRRRQVTGSGVVASEDGGILTNHHVVDEAEKVIVSVPGRKKKYPARVIGADKQTDIALVRIEPETPLAAASFGTADRVQVGQWVLAIGNPYGLDGTVSLGIVSAKGRDLEIPDLLNAFIQTDAMIDRGSSGGPLVDLDGEVIGINSRGQGRGIGFTIPVDTALEVMAQLERGGIERGYLGITMQALDRELADYFGIPTTTGVIVNSVAEESPAQGAGLEPGDIITHFNGTEIEAEKDEDLGALQRLVAAVEPGEKVEVRLMRDGEARTVRLKTGRQPKVDPDRAETDVGFHVQEITANLARGHRFPNTEGAFVNFVARGTPASEAGLRIGDVIEWIEETQVKDLDDFRRAMGETEDRSRFLITARRGQEQKFLLVNRSPQPATPEAPKTPGETGHPGEPH
jgi:S1-C subfamily serine protease